MRTIIVNSPGPQGATGPQGIAGPSGSTQPFSNVSASVWATTSNLQISGSTIISSSNATQLLVGTNSLFVNSSGNVGIGTTTPSAKLQIKGSGTTSATTSLRVENTNASASLVVLDNGFVGIGTTTDTGYKLDVNGTARIVSDALINGLTVGRGGSSVDGNTVVGFEAGLNNTTGNITAFGYQAGKGNTTSNDNLALGYGALRTNSTGSFNVAVGTFALRDSTVSSNTAVGSPALLSNTTGIANVAVGQNSLRTNLTGNYNTAIGNESLRSSTASNNIALGYGAGYNSGNNANTTGANNIFIGNNSIGVSATDSNRTWIGNASTATTWLGGNVLIGTTTNIASSKLTIESTTQGFLPPRMTTTQKNAIATPASGLVVYDTDLSKINFYNGASWNNTGLGVTQVTPVTLASGSWSLVSSLYEYNYSNVLITSSSIVDIIPDNSTIAIVQAAQVLPSTVSTSGSVKLFATNLPTADIIVTVNIFN